MKIYVKDSQKQTIRAFKLRISSVISAELLRGANSPRVGAMCTDVSALATLSSVFDKHWQMLYLDQIRLTFIMLAYP